MTPDNPRDVLAAVDDVRAHQRLGTIGLLVPHRPGEGGVLRQGQGVFLQRAGLARDAEIAPDLAVYAPRRVD